MSYFNNFPVINYNFGDEGYIANAQNLSIYVDVLDQVKNLATSYEDYFVLPDQRPDQVSLELYNTTDYYWTFFIVNDHLREQGWPLSNEKLYDLAIKLYPEVIITTDDVIHDKFKVGTTVRGAISAAEGNIIHRNLDLGQVWVKSTTGTTFDAGETVNRIPIQTPTESIVCHSSEFRYNAAHHLEDVNGNWADQGFDSDGSLTLPIGAQLTEKTWFEYLENQNNKLKQIKVIKSDIIAEIVKTFNESISI